jgi:hypothetical protein
MKKIDTEKMYTKINGCYVMPDPGDLKPLGLDSCVVARTEGKLYVHPLGEAAGKPAEREGLSYDPIFGFSKEEGERFFILDGKRKELRFCDLCKDRLNGITGNCFDFRVKPKGCAFDPSTPPAPFNISLEGWTKVKPTDVSRDTPFSKPYSPSYVHFDLKTIRRNQKMRLVRRHLWEYQQKKQQKYCSRCIFEGLCYLNTRKVVEHCIVTNEKTEARCLESIRRRYGSAEEFLRLLSYAGSEIRYKPRSAKRRTKWRVSYPINRKKFLVRKLARPFTTAEVSLSRIEKQANSKPLPLTNQEHAAALAWFFMEEHMIGKTYVWVRGGRRKRPFWILLKEEGIEVVHYPYGYSLRLDSVTLESFNESLHYGR